VFFNRSTPGESLYSASFNLEPTFDSFPLCDARRFKETVFYLPSVNYLGAHAGTYECALHGLIPPELQHIVNSTLQLDILYTEFPVRDAEGFTDAGFVYVSRRAVSGRCCALVAFFPLSGSVTLSFASLLCPGDAKFSRCLLRSCGIRATRRAFRSTWYRTVVAGSSRRSFQVGPLGVRYGLDHALCTPEEDNIVQPP
jgi:hypothetical protein